MSLLVAPPPAGTLLGQGDLLEVKLHGTANNGAPCDFKAKYGLVISRECAGAHKPQVIVASVVDLKDRLLSDDEIQTARTADKPHEALPKLFNTLRTSLETTRDGGLSPDRIYLGNLPGDVGKLVAKLDELATVELPEEGAERQTWIDAQRRARLSPDASRALPTRLFWAFARVGFNDHEWLPDPDLRALCAAGDAAVGATQTHLGELELRLSQSESAAEAEGKLKNLRNLVEKARRGHEKLVNELAPFKAELARRTPPEEDAP